MPACVIQHGFAGLPGEGDDHYVNTFHMATPGAADLGIYFGEVVSPATTSIGEQLALLIRGFYDGHAVTASNNPGYYLSQAVANPGEFLKIYDLDAALHSPPVFSYLYEDVIEVGDNPSLPAEIAVCLTIEAYATGVLAGTGAGSKARRRNRMYIGPLSHAAESSSTSTGSSRPNATLREALCREYIALVDAAGLIGIDLGVYSKADDTFAAPTRVWVDDAWDTQRRRGQNASGKTVGIWT